MGIFRRFFYNISSMKLGSGMPGPNFILLICACYMLDVGDKVVQCSGDTIGGIEQHQVTGIGEDDQL
ncbi:hypothetical protein KDH_53150 [Dictyobacter sp. S3.2.2.5]|uniref:Uncharacterized protein n=1 Tax=Dictyobacter halimunensis TaxID=3026934 RepID=A0ABQ6FW47_9CHLR|nr:hypothetical protein KDH_53150 [Dictyobacter sp. S3.2.2.5]